LAVNGVDAICVDKSVAKDDQNSASLKVFSRKQRTDSNKTKTAFLNERIAIFGKNQNGAYETRTHDLHTASVALSQLS
jgi:hypothetical protein